MLRTQFALAVCLLSTCRAQSSSKVGPGASRRVERTYFLPVKNLDPDGEDRVADPVIRRPACLQVVSAYARTGTSVLKRLGRVGGRFWQVIPRL